MKEEKQQQIVIYKTNSGQPKIEVKLEDETVWLNQAQISQLFSTERSVITKHLGNIFKSGELQEKSNVQILHIAGSDKPVKCYCLDVVISVGYRVNSKRATQFRIWATQILRDHILKGYTVNRERLSQLQGKRLDELEAAVGLIKRTIESRQLTSGQEKGLLKVITDYANAWVLLTKYDNGQVAKPKGLAKAKYSLSLDDALGAIDGLQSKMSRKLGDSQLFGKQRQDGLASIVGALNQTFGRKPLYPTIEDKAAHLLYFIIKDHPFVDGNKRIGAFLFIYFLSRSNYLLKKNGEKKINDNALVALTLLVAESDPQEKDVIIRLIMNFLAK